MTTWRVPHVQGRNLKRFEYLIRVKRVELHTCVNAVSALNTLEKWLATVFAKSAEESRVV